MDISDYFELIKTRDGEEYSSFLPRLSEKLTDLWIADYNKRTINTDIVEFTDAGFSFLFDLSENNSEPFVAGKTKEARIVVAYGVTKNNTARRDRSRMQGFIGGFESIPGYIGYDKGHFISHKIGGMLDQNLFPQKKEVNRGWSEDGKRYRKIERYCEHNEGIFMFSRPVYNNASWIPAEIEIGYLSKDFQFVIERVNN